MTGPDVHTDFIRGKALQLGFMSCGIARAEKLDSEARHLEKWLKDGNHAGMAYMERNFDLRIDPTRLVPGAKSVITLLFNYFPEEKQKENAL